MEAATWAATDADFLVGLAQPHSPGVTSILKQYFGDDGCFDEVDSGGAEPQQLRAALVVEQPQGAASSELKGLLPRNPLAYDVHQTRYNDSPLAVPESAEMYAEPIALKLKTEQAPHIQFASSSCHAAAGHKKRGRKPLPKASDLQAKLQSLAGQLQSLTDENLFLRNKLKVLERVVPYRDESAGHLTQLLSSASSHAAAAAKAAARAGTPEDADALTSGPSPRSPDTQEQSPASSGDNSSFCSGQATASAGEVHSSLLRASPHSMFRKASSTGGVASCAGNTAKPPHCGAPAVLALCPTVDGVVPEITLASVEELKRITPADFRLLWKHVCMQLGVLVSGAEVHGPGSSPYIRLERFLERALAYMDKLTLLSPACFVQSMYMNVENGQPERPNDSFWIACARSLNLTPQQLAEVHSLAAVYQKNIIPVVQQRLQLAMQLSTRLAAASAQPASAGEALTALSSVDELAEQLERNVLKEHQTHWNIGDFLCSSVLSPLQVAKALTASYPYIPDGVAIMHAFKVISNDSAQAVPRPAGSLPEAQGQGGQQFPSLAGLLASQLPALAGLLAAGGTAMSARAGVTAAQAGSGGVPSAALAGVLGGLQPTQLQALLSRLQPAQLQALSAVSQPAQMLAALASSARTGAHPVATAPAAVQPPAGPAVNPQLLLALLMGSNAGGQRGTNGHAVSASATNGA